MTHVVALMETRYDGDLHFNRNRISLNYRLMEIYILVQKNC